VLDQEARGRTGIERGHEIVGMPAERRGDAAILAYRKIVRLADVVEHVELDHEMMDAVLSGFQHREVVMPRIDVEEVDLERLHHVVAQPQPEHVLIKPQHVLDALDREHDVSHAERPSAEPGNGAARPERLDRGLGAVKSFEPVAEGIGERDELPDSARLGERLRLPLDAYPRSLEPRGEPVERHGIRDFPTEKAGPIRGVGLDEQPLAAVVHAQAQGQSAALDQLHAEKAFAETRPILEVAGAQPDVAERLQFHVRLLARGNARVPRSYYRIRPAALRALHGAGGRGGDRAPPCPKSAKFHSIDAASGRERARIARLGVFRQPNGGAWSRPTRMRRNTELPMRMAAPIAGLLLSCA